MTTTRIQRSRHHKYNPAQEAGQPVIYCGRPSVYGNPFVSKGRGKGELFLKERDNTGTVMVEVIAPHTFSPVFAADAFHDWLVGEAQLSALWRIHCAQELSSTVVHVGHRARAAILRGIPALRGRTLSCWCAPDAPCHVDTLIRLCDDPEAYQKALEA